MNWKYYLEGVEVVRYRKYFKKRYRGGRELIEIFERLLLEF